MATSPASLAFVAVASLLSVPACTRPQPGAASVQFAMPTASAVAALAPAVRVGAVRVLSRHVNLQEAVVMAASGNEVSVTFALKERDGATLLLDAESLEPRTILPYSYPPLPRPTTLPFQAAEPSRSSLEDGSSLVSWTDEASSRVLVQAFGADRSRRGPPVVVSPEGMDVFGAPHIATADGRHVVVAFFACNGDGFALMAASLEPVR